MPSHSFPCRRPHENTMMGRSLLRHQKAGLNGRTFGNALNPSMHRWKFGLQIDTNATDIPVKTKTFNPDEFHRTAKHEFVCGSLGPCEIDDISPRVLEKSRKLSVLSAPGGGGKQVYVTCLSLSCEHRVSRSLDPIHSRTGTDHCQPSNLDL